jgi:ABC-type glycerol-3-phosphate transport system permease component
MWSGVLRKCSFAKCVCKMLMICVVCVVISLVVGSLMAYEFGLVFSVKV